MAIDEKKQTAKEMFEACGMMQCKDRNEFCNEHGDTWVDFDLTWCGSKRGFAVGCGFEWVDVSLEMYFAITQWLKENGWIE